MVGQDVLVGRDDGLAGLERLGDQRAGRLVAAQQLHDHVHVLASDDRRRVRHDELAGHAAVHGALDVHVGDGDQLEHPAAGRADAPVGLA